MDWNQLEKHFSSARLGRYLVSCDGDKQRAARAYVKNVLLAEAMMPMLNVLEIALKNGIHSRLASFYKRVDWWETWTGVASFDWQMREIGSAKVKLQRRAEALTADKIVAELAFGAHCSMCTFRLCFGKNYAWCFHAARNHRGNVKPYLLH
jgi:hypothetical protein